MSNSIFNWEPAVNVMDLPEDVAIMILGRPVYEAAKAARKDPVKQDVLMVIAVDRENKTVTYGSCSEEDV